METPPDDPWDDIPHHDAGADDIMLALHHEPSFVLRTFGNVLKMHPSMILLGCVTLIGCIYVKRTAKRGRMSNINSSVSAKTTTIANSSLNSSSSDHNKHTLHNLLSTPPTKYKETVTALSDVISSTGLDRRASLELANSSLLRRLEEEYKESRGTQKEHEGLWRTS